MNKKVFLLTMLKLNPVNEMEYEGQKQYGWGTLIIGLEKLYLDTTDLNKDSNKQR